MSRRTFQQKPYRMEAKVWTADNRSIVEHWTSLVTSRVGKRRAIDLYITRLMAKYPDALGIDVRGEDYDTIPAE
jgi:hypothetical protein